MRVPVRSLATVVLAVGVATCADAPTVGRARVAAVNGGSARGAIAMEPVFSNSAAAVYAQREVFAGANFDHVRIVLVRPGPPADTLRDTTITFTPGSQPQAVEFTVAVAATNEAFTGAFDYTNNGQVVYHGSQTVFAHSADQPAPPEQKVVIAYVGPGANVTRVTVTPKTVTVVAPGSATFTAAGFDASNNPVANNPVSWSVSDATVATISAAGVLSTTGKRGTVTVSATSIAGPSDGASATVTLPPAAIALVSGGGQTGKAGAALPQSATVKVTATDGIGVSGATVTFAPPTGGAVGSSSVTTDANGTASTSLTLGGAVGPQSFAAVVETFSVSIGATATPGDPSTIAAVSGSGQQDTVKKGLAAPFVVKVGDKFGNGVPGVTVAWARTAGTGSLAGTSSVTGADGTSSMGYTLGTTPGAESVTASVSGIVGSASFTAQALAAGPAAIATVSGGGQSGRAQQPLPAPFVVRVTDIAGNPVSGATVNWSATNGTIPATTTTDANGQSSNTMTLGTTLGNASATATIGTGVNAKSTTFAVTVQAGTVAQLAFRTGPPASAGVGAVLAPPIVVELRDAAGNVTSAVNAVSIALGANPGKATLAGTLTVNAVAGIATFNDLTVSAPGNGYTLVASSAGVPSVASATFNIVGAAADTWTGSTSTAWLTAGNWSAGVPTPTTPVLIPAGTPNAPTLNTDASITDLTVAAGATLSVVGEATLTASGNVSALGTIVDVGADLRMSGAAKTFRGTATRLAVDGTVSFNGPITISETTVDPGATLTVAATTGALGFITVSGGTLAIGAGAVVTATDITVGGATAVFAQTGGTLTVSNTATFAGAATAGQITSGTLTVGGNFSQQAFNSTQSFTATGTHRTIFNGATAQTITFASAAASGFHDVEIDGLGPVTLGSSFSASGQLISATGATPVSGGGNTMFVAGLNVDGMSLNNALISTSGGSLTRFDNVTFQGYAGTATPLTITHPGAATAFTFNNTQFLVTPTSGRYLNVTDSNASDGQVLTINLVNSVPPDGSAQTATAGGALVNWQATGATIAWTNASGGGWSTPSNWSLGRVPVPGDSVVIALAGTYTVTIDTTFTGRSIVVGAASGTQTLALAGRFLTLGNFLTINANGVFAPATSTLAGAGTVVNKGTLRLVNSTVTASLNNQGTFISGGNSAINGPFTTATGSILRLQGDNSVSNSILTVANGFVNNGAIELTTANQGFTVQLTVTNGTLTNVAGATITSFAGALGLRSLNAQLDNQGSFIVQQPVTINRAGSAISNSGTIDLTASDLSITQSGTTPSVSNSGTVTIGNGHTLAITGGALNVNGGAISGQGTVSLQSVTANLGIDVSNATTALVLNATTVNGPGVLTNAAGKTLTFNNSTTNGTLVNQGTLINGGTSVINGPFTTATGSILRLQGDNSVSNSILTVANGFVNNGAIELTTANQGFTVQLAVTNGSLVNAGTITSLTGALGLRSLNAQLDNQGSFIVQQPVTMNRAGSAITNSGTIDLTASDLSITQSGTTPSVSNTGTVSIGNGHTFAISGGVLNQNAGAINGPGTLSLQSVTANFTTNVSTGATPLLLNATTINGPGVFTNSAGKTLTFNNSTTNGTLVNQGTFINGGTSVINGPFTTATGSILRLQGDNSVSNSILTVNSATGLTNNGAIELTTANQGFTVQLAVTNGTLTNVVGATITSIVGALGLRSLNAQLDNQGSFIVQQPVTMARASSAISNSGTIDLTASDLSITQSGTTPSVSNSGTVTIGNGHTLAITGGALNVNGGAISGQGTVSLQSVTANLGIDVSNATTALVLNATTVNGPGVLTNAAGKALTFNNSTINTTLVNQGTFINGGTSVINGLFTTATNSILRLQGDNSVSNSILTVNSPTGLTNNGAIELTTANQGFTVQLTVTNGTLTNVVGATITSIVGALGLRSLNAQLDNQGSFIVQQPVTMARASSAITNSGTIDLTASDLSITQSGTTPSFTNTGTVSIGNGHTFAITGGVLNQNAGAINGPGTLSLQSVTANFTTNVSTGATPMVLNATTVNGPGVFTNSAGKTLTFNNSTANGTLANQGTLISGGTSVINGPFGTTVGSILRLQGDNSVSNSVLTVNSATGLPNNGAIELTTVNQGFTVQLTVTNGSLANANTGTITSFAGALGLRVLNAQLDNQGSFIVQQPVTMNRASSVITNSGTIDLTAGDLSITQSGTTPSFTNSGTVTIGTGHVFTLTGGTLTLNAGAGQITGAGTFAMSGGTANINTGVGVATMTLSGLTAANFGTNFTTTGVNLNIAATPVNGAVTITNAAPQTLTLNAATISAQTTITNQGTLLALGNTTIGGALANSGTISIGSGGTGTLSVGTFNNSGTINIKIASATLFDQIAVTGTATLAPPAGLLGTVNVSLIGGFTPSSGATFNALTYTSVIGNFLTLTPGWLSIPGPAALALKAP